MRMTSIAQPTGVVPFQKQTVEFYTLGTYGRRTSRAFIVASAPGRADDSAPSHREPHTGPSTPTPPYDIESTRKFDVKRVCTLPVAEFWKDLLISTRPTTTPLLVSSGNLACTYPPTLLHRAAATHAAAPLYIHYTRPGQRPLC